MQVPVDSQSLGHSEFMLAICGFVAVYILVAMLGARLSYNFQFSRPILYLGYIFGCALVAIVTGSIAEASSDPVLSAMGGAACALAMGYMVGPLVSTFEVNDVVQAFVLTAGVVMVTGLIGAVIPQDLSSWGAPLLGLLFGAIVLSVGNSILGAFGLTGRLAATVLHWGILILFCFMMVYDLNRAKAMVPSYDAAVDVAVNVFLNAANIFLRILILMGDSKS